MQEIFKLLIGLAVLVLGYFIGNLLAGYTKEELKQGRRYFQIIIFLSLILGIIGLIISNDAILFSFFFIAIVASRSL